MLENVESPFKATHLLKSTMAEHRQIVHHDQEVRGGMNGSQKLNAIIAMKLATLNPTVLNLVDP